MASTGARYEIAAGRVHATIDGVGAGLRAFRVDGVHHVETFDADPPMGAGQVLAPWPNRVAGARFAWRGATYALDVTEPDRGHALHGLVRDRTWEPVAHDDASVTLAVAITDGWPQPVTVRTTYAVAEPGALTVTHAIVNAGDGPVPVGLGTHPYLRVGDHPSGDCTLVVATTTVVDVDDVLIPVGAPRPDGSPRAPRRVADLDLDTCFGADTTAEYLAELRAPDGTGTRLWGDEHVRWVQVFTPAGPFGRPGKAVAVEPMTCPPDALNSGVDLAVLEPGATWTVRWGLEAV